MAILETIRNEFSLANKNLTSTQTSQFKELKNDLKQLSAQIIELKAENTNLRSELEILRNKVTSLENTGVPDHIPHIVSEVFKESFDRERCSLITIVYGVPESPSSSSTQRISDDSSAIHGLLEPHNHIPDNAKIIRLGKVVSDKTRPLKLLCDSKESASKIVSDFRASVKKGAQFPAGFRIVNDKTLLQRNLFRSCHAELENRRLNGETNLEVSYVNGAPQVRIAKSKNSGSPPNARHR